MICTPRLLAAGIVGVEGDFSAGDPVDVVDPDGAVIARGLVNYDSDELPGMLGRSTAELAAEHGLAPVGRRQAFLTKATAWRKG